MPRIDYFLSTMSPNVYIAGQRLEEIADGGEILLTETTRKLLAGTSIRVKPKGMTSIRGRSESIAVYALQDLEGGEHE